MGHRTEARHTGHCGLRRESHVQHVAGLPSGWTHSGRATLRIGKPTPQNAPTRRGGGAKRRLLALSRAAQRAGPVPQHHTGTVRHLWGRLEAVPPRQGNPLTPPPPPVWTPFSHYEGLGTRSALNCPDKTPTNTDGQPPHQYPRPLRCGNNTNVPNLDGNNTSSSVVRRGVLDLEASYIRLTCVLHPSYMRLTSVLHPSYMCLRFSKTPRLTTVMTPHVALTKGGVFITGKRGHGSKRCGNNTCSRL